MKLLKTALRILCGSVCLCLCACSSGQTRPEFSMPAASGSTASLNDAQTETQRILASASEAPLDSLISVQYSVQDLMENFDCLSDSNLAFLHRWNQQFPVECLRTFNDGTCYCVYKAEEGGLVYAFFELKEGVGIPRYLFYATSVVPNNAFTKLGRGTPAGELNSLDPGLQPAIAAGGEIYTNYLSASFHLTEGGVAKITYQGETDEKFVIDTCTLYHFGEEIPVKNGLAFRFTLLAQDYEDYFS